MASPLGNTADKDMRGVVLRIERSSIHDGAGLRTVVFLKGCPLSCRWCSTPESQRAVPERGYLRERCRSCCSCVAACPADALAYGRSGMAFEAGRCRGCFLCVEKCPHEALRRYGTVMTVGEVVAEISREEIFFFHSGGGVTLSGGECLQQPDFVAAILAECRYRGIDTAVETSLFVPWRNLVKVLPLLNTFFVDLKHSDALQHRELTGVDNRLILKNLQRLDESELPFRICLRIPLIPGINDSDDNLLNILEIAGGLRKAEELEILPYHRLGVNTYTCLQREYDLQDVGAPSREYIAERLQFLRGQNCRLPIKAGGGFFA